jgi:hypothetical protein
VAWLAIWPMPPTNPRGDGIRANCSPRTSAVVARAPSPQLRFVGGLQRQTPSEGNPQEDPFAFYLIALQEPLVPVAMEPVIFNGGNRAPAAVRGKAWRNPPSGLRCQSTPSPAARPVSAIRSGRALLPGSTHLLAAKANDTKPLSQAVATEVGPLCPGPFRPSPKSKSLSVHCSHNCGFRGSCEQE